MTTLNPHAPLANSNDWRDEPCIGGLRPFTMRWLADAWIAPWGFRPHTPRRTGAVAQTAPEEYKQNAGVGQFLNVALGQFPSVANTATGPQFRTPLLSWSTVADTNWGLAAPKPPRAPVAGHCGILSSI